ncbi:Condensin-2 complex subunit G2 [Echinococcus multilocularis]|uniref:Condensin-2 complex subunit G2 n=1 Tax=Echinococcus multilocularis TaxID=6211 RepID=A0A0S4MI44_ECHMU|nr:Condensin-2 complex subunit G2 [Echinococcus multilocularis]
MVATKFNKQWNRGIICIALSPAEFERLSSVEELTPLIDLPPSTVVRLEIIDYFDAAKWMVQQHSSVVHGCRGLEAERQESSMSRGVACIVEQVLARCYEVVLKQIACLQLASLPVVLGRNNKNQQFDVHFIVSSRSASIFRWWKDGAGNAMICQQGVQFLLAYPVVASPPPTSNNNVD